MRDEVFPIDAIARVKVAGMTLDLVRAELLGADGAVVELRPQALAVLCRLAAAAGRVVSKDELFAAVWPRTVVTDDSLVQAVADIRRALGPAASRAIRTMPRRGYMLVADADGDVASNLPAAAVPVSPLPDAPVPLTSVMSGRSRRWFVIGSGAALLAGIGFPAALWWSREQRDGVGSRQESTVAMLPFESRVVDGTRSWIGEGLGLGITSALTRLSGLSVLSARTLPGPPQEPTSRVAEAVRKHATHLLSGTIESDSQRVRATMQLTVATTGLVVWSERYDRPLSDLFALEDEIIAKTVTALQVKLLDGEQARSRTNPKGNLQAWELATRGYERFETGGPGPLAQARQFLEEALRLDPDYAWARAYLAATCFIEARFGFVRDREASMARALAESTRATISDPSLPDAHSTLGSILLAQREFEPAVMAGRKAIELGPSHADVHAVLAQTMLATGDWSRAVALSQKAIALTMRHPSWYLVPQGYGYVYLDRPTDALKASRQMLDLAESPFMRRAALLAVAFAEIESGQVAEARHTVAGLAPLRPGLAAGTAAANLLFKEKRHADRLTSALRTAGLPA